MESKTAKSLKKGIVVVLIANIVNLVVSLLRSFLLPKYLSVETYADIKLYQLYISYAGFAALGYIDGMYLKYGGKSLLDIDRKELNRNVSTFRIFQLLISFVLFLVGVIKKDYIFCAMSLSIVALNMADYYKCLFQATGEFSLYSRIMNISSVSLFVVSLVLLFILKIEKSVPYIVSYVFIYYIVWLFLEIRLNRGGVKGNPTYFSIIECKTSINSGWSLMIGTFVSTFMTGLDRWCVKLTMDTYAFALYSFAASVVGFLAYAISPIAITLYNYFCKDHENINYKKIRQMILLFVTIIIAGAFPVKFILEHYLEKYYFAQKVIFILFSGQVLYGFIKCYYVNLYKASKQQNKYMRGIIIVAISGVAFNILLYLLYNDMISFSIGTMLAGVVWLFLCAKDFPENKNSLIELLYSIILIVSFIVCGFIFKSYIGFSLYILTWIGASVLLMRESLCGMIDILIKGLKRRISH